MRVIALHCLLAMSLMGTGVVAHAEDVFEADSFPDIEWRYVPIAIRFRQEIDRQLAAVAGECNPVRVDGLSPVRLEFLRPWENLLLLRSEDPLYAYMRLQP